jgi:hypothetical protein
MRNLAQVANKEERKSYFKSINRITGHLQKKHKLITEGYFLGIGMALGTAIGVAIGSSFDNVGSGIPIGLSVGVLIGAVLEARAAKEGRVICPSETTSLSKPALVLAIVGVLIAVGLIAFQLLRRST